MKQVTGATASSKRMSIECMPFFTMEVFRWCLKIWQWSSLSFSKQCWCVSVKPCVCVCKRTCMYVCVFFSFCESAPVCALRRILQALPEFCVLVEMAPAQLCSCGLLFWLSPPSASSLLREGFVLNFPVCVWLLCCGGRGSGDNKDSWWGRLTQ